MAARAAARRRRGCWPSGGAAVVLGARRTERPGHDRSADRDQGGRAISRVTDVTRGVDLRRLVDGAVAEYGRLDVLVSNAGISKIGPMADLDVDGWQAMIDVNLRGRALRDRRRAAGVPAAGPRPPGDHGVHRRAEDRPHPGGLRRDQERRPYPAGRTAAGIDRRRAADHGRYRRVRPTELPIPSTTPASARRSFVAGMSSPSPPTPWPGPSPSRSSSRTTSRSATSPSARPSRASDRRSPRLAGSGLRPEGSGLGTAAPEPAASGRRQRMRIGITVAETGGDQALVKLADQLRRAADDGLALGPGCRTSSGSMH